MRVVLEIDLNIHGTKLRQGGEFNLRYNQSIPEFAYSWIQQTKRETGYRPTIIEKVILNGSEDITDQVRAIESRPIPDLDFLW